MIKVNYDPQTTLVLGYYPDSINYASIPKPFIEISDEEHRNALGKIMCVNDGVFQEYQPTLEEAKVAKIREIKSKRDIFLSANITVSTGEYKATPTAKSLFFNAVNGRAVTQYPMNWRLADDITWVSLTKNEAYELYDAFEAQEASGYHQESDFITRVNSAQIVEELNNININFN